MAPTVRVGSIGVVGGQGAAAAVIDRQIIRNSRGAVALSPGAGSGRPETPATGPGGRARRRPIRGTFPSAGNLFTMGRESGGRAGAWEQAAGSPRREAVPLVVRLRRRPIRGAAAVITRSAVDGRREPADSPAREP